GRARGVSGRAAGVGPVREHDPRLPAGAASRPGRAARQPGADEDGRSAPMGRGPRGGPRDPRPAGDALELHPRAHRGGRRRAARSPGGGAVVKQRIARFDLDRSDAVDLTILSREEIDRAGRFRRAVDSRRSLAARTFLRRELAEFLGVPPGRIVLSAGPHGKPELLSPRGSWAFSLAHSGARALLAVAAE